MNARFSRSLAATLFAFGPTVAIAQQPTASAAPSAASAPAMPNVGDMAPDFTIRGATRYGLLANRPRLSPEVGQTVVLAFFIQARTRG